MALKPGTIKKPRTKWFGIMSNFSPGTDLIPMEFALIWDLASRIDGDPAWQQWWQPLSGTRLELRPIPNNSPVPLTIRQVRHKWLVQGGGPQMLRGIIVFESAPKNVWDPAWVHSRQPVVDEATTQMETAVVQLLLEASEPLGLEPAPTTIRPNRG